MLSRKSQDFVTVVSGLPRSGTSMMMRMLDAGGMPVLIDHVRERDIDNPRGYYEFEPVKSLRRDSGWVIEAQGVAVKIIYLLLRDLPASCRYRVIFMERELAEVVASQDAMMARRGAAARHFDNPHEIAHLFESHLREIHQWLGQQDNFSVLGVRYKDVVNEPRGAAARVNDFLGGGLDLERMAATVDPALYRQRAESC